MSNYSIIHKCVFSKTDPFFGNSQINTYHIEIDEKGNVSITLKRKFNSPSHPPTYDEKSLLEIKDNIPLSNNMIDICKFILDKIRDDNENEDTMGCFISWLAKTKQIMSENKKLEEENNQLSLKIKKVV